MRFPPPSAIDDVGGEEEEPFYFAIDCWPEVSGQAGEQEEEEEFCPSSDRLCKIPKALQMSHSDVMNEGFIDNIVSILQPLAGLVHVVLIGKGAELIRCNHSRDPAVTTQSVQISIHEQSAQLGALALTLAKHGIPLVSILDGGYGSVLRCFWNSEHAEEDEEEEEEGDKKLMLSFDFLFDVDHDAIRTLFLGDDDGASEEDGRSDKTGVMRPQTPLSGTTSKSDSITETSSLLGTGNSSKSTISSKRMGDEEYDACAHDSVGEKSRGPPTAAYLSDMLSSSGSSVAAGVAGLFSKNKMFSYGSS